MRTPLIKEDGEHRPASWDEAFALIEEKLGPIVAEHGPNAVGMYLGNPNVHSMSGTLYVRAFVKMLRSRNVFTAATVDQMPKHVTSGYMFGRPHPGTGHRPHVLSADARRQSVRVERQPRHRT